ncbi:MAG TPA: HD domain-containing phosphohydrolase [Bacilli bacterium]
MRYINLDAVEPGQLLGKTIYSANGTVLLAAGVQLTVFMISTLRRIGVTMLYMKDPNFNDVVIIDMVSEETKRAVMKQIGETFETIRSGKELNTKNISINMDSLIDDVMRNKEVLLHLTDIRTVDNMMYVHALNVATMATLIGINLNIPYNQLKELAIGALLHDVGKVGGENEENLKDLKKHHTWRGFEILKLKREFSLMIAHVAFQHHESLDGKGIPRGLEADQIHLYAKITAIANLYDNLLFDSSKETPMLPHEACELMMSMAGQQIDKDLLVQFLNTVSIYPTGISVKLSNHEVGLVVGQHRGLPGRPIVRIVKEDPGHELIVKEIDLAKHTTLFIDMVL